MNIPLLTATKNRIFNTLIGANKLATLEDINNVTQYINNTVAYVNYAYLITNPGGEEGGPYITSHLYGDGCDTSCTCPKMPADIGCDCTALAGCNDNKQSPFIIKSFTAGANGIYELVIGTKYISANVIGVFFSNPKHGKYSVGCNLNEIVRVGLYDEYSYTITTWNSLTQSLDATVIDNMYINLQIYTGQDKLI